MQEISEVSQNKLPGIKRVYVVLALAITLAVGMAAGYALGLRQAEQNPVLVVITATPQPVAQVTSSPKAATVAQAATPTIMEFLLSDARHFEGTASAPVTIIEFSDFKCPFCGHFVTETLSRLRSEYVQTGQVRFVYKHYAILGPESVRGAEASECATEQNHFWEFHDAVFADQVANHSSLTDNKLTQLAGQLNLDTAKFSECLASGRYTDKIQRESIAVQSLGVRGTPAFLINGVFISGAQPFEVFQQTIQEQLQQTN
jgi:protein-disulfide isomerase